MVAHQLLVYADDVYSLVQNISTAKKHMTNEDFENVANFKYLGHSW
jgi:hypothetical protein